MKGGGTPLSYRSFVRLKAAYQEVRGGWYDMARRGYPQIQPTLNENRSP